MADPIFVSIFSGAVSMYEKLKVKEGLAKILSDNGRDEYIATVQSAYPFAAIILPKLYAKTKTHVDDDLGVAFKEAIEESAAENGVTLPDITGGA